MDAFHALYHRRPKEEEDVDREPDPGDSAAARKHPFVEEFDEVAFDVGEAVAAAKPAQEPERETGRGVRHNNCFLNVVFKVM